MAPPRKTAGGAAGAPRAGGKKRSFHQELVLNRWMLGLSYDTTVSSLTQANNSRGAFELSLTERTIKMHRAAMLRALNVRTVAEAIRIAIEAGF